MTTTKAPQKSRQQIQAEDIHTWFKDHVAQITHMAPATGAGAMEKSPFDHDMIQISWRKPGTWVYGMGLIFMRGFLFVWGDLGEATYQWSGEASPEFIAGCDLDYFASKCQASEYGRGGKEWDNDVARESLLSLIHKVVDEKAEELCNSEGVEWITDPETGEEVEPESDFDRMTEEQKKLWRDKAEAVLIEDAENQKFRSSSGNWAVQYLLRGDLCQYDDGRQGMYKFFEDNPFDIDCVYELVHGEVISLRVHSHLMAVKMAVRQLKEKGLL